MDNYDEDFEEEIIDESIEDDSSKNKKPPLKKGQNSGISSQQDSRAQAAARGSMRGETDRKSRNGVRKTVALSKQSIKKEPDDYYTGPLKNITNTKLGSRNKTADSYDEEDAEDEVKTRHLNAIKSESPKTTSKKLRLKEFDIEGLGIRGSADKRSAHSTPRSRTSQAINFSYYDRFRDVLESDVTGKTTKELEGENNKLRENLKDLNEQLTKIIERARVATLAPKVVEFKNKNAEDKLRTIEKEMVNNKQILEFTFTEYNTLKTKLDRIKNATYIIDLDDKIKDALAKTEALKKENKALSLAAGNIAKDLKDIDKAEGLAPALVEANEKAKELAIARRKLKKVQDMNNDLDEESRTKKARYEKVQEEYKKLYSEAEQFKVTAEDNKLANKCSQLQSQVKSLEDYIKFASNNNEKYLKNQLERNIEELYINNLKDNENVERLSGMIEEQKAVLREMIEKEEQKSDKQTLGVILKIKDSLDTGKFMTEPPDVNENKPKVKSLTNLQSKNAKKPKDMYADLPLFTPSGAKGESVQNKKDIKKELNAIKENAKREDRSRTPEAKPPQNTESSKPSLRPSNKREQDSPRDQVKIPETKEEEKNKGEEEFTMKPSFSKPAFGKKKEQPLTGESLQLPDKTQGNQPQSNFGSEGLTLGGPKNQGLTLGNQNQPLTLGNQNQPLTLGNQNQPLTLGGPQKLTFDNNSKNQPLTLGNQNQPLTLGNQNQPLTLGGDNKSFGTNQGAFGKKEELSLSGQHSQSKSPPEKKNEELTLGDNDSNFQLGGLSRLNRAKRGGGPGNVSTFDDSSKTQGLTLPGQKPPANAGPQGLTLPGNNNPPEQKNVFDYKANNQQSNDIWGSSQNKQAQQPLTLEKKDEPTQRGGRDRSHLVGSKPEETLTLGGKKEPTTNPTQKVGFDPDDIFAPSNKSPEKTETNTNAGTLGPTGIPGVRTGRGGVAGRPRQVGDDDFLSGPNKNTSNNQQPSLGFGGKPAENSPKNSVGFGNPVNQSDNANKGGFGGGFGGGGFGGGGFGGGGFGGGGFGGGFGQGDSSNKTGLTGPTATETTGLGVGDNNQGRSRMRMNDIKSKGDTTKEKEKNLASKAEKGGFFGDFDD